MFFVRDGHEWSCRMVYYPQPNVFWSHSIYSWILHSFNHDWYEPKIKDEKWSEGTILGEVVPILGTSSMVDSVWTVWMQCTSYYQYELGKLECSWKITGMMKQILPKKSWSPFGSCVTLAWGMNVYGNLTTKHLFTVRLSP